MTSNSSQLTKMAIGSIDPMEWLFGEFYGMFGNPFLDKFRSGIFENKADGEDTGIKNMKLVWLEKIRSNQLKMSDIKRGLKACEKMKFPPSWGEFLTACKPSIDPMVAYYEAIAGVQARQKGEMGQWSHPAIFWAAMPLSFDLGVQTYSQMKTRWEKALSDQMERGEWGAIPEPMLALPKPDKRISREEAAAALQKIGAAEVLMPKSDHKLWAKRIKQRQADGDRTLTTIQIKFADEALA